MVLDNVAVKACVYGINDENVEECLDSLQKFHHLCRETDQYLKDGTVDERFRARIFAILIDIGDFSKVLRDRHPWLNEFESSTGDFRLSLEQFYEDRTSMPDILACWVRLRFCEIASDLWTSQVKSKLKASPSALNPAPLSEMAYSMFGPNSQPKPSGASFSDTDDLLLSVRRSMEWAYWMKYETIDGLRIMISCFFESFSQIEDKYSWKSLVSQLRTFVEIVQCSEPLDDPFKCLGSFRKTVLASTSKDREAKLELEVTRLEQKLKENEAKLAEQDKTLFCLKFRHILERLPPREGKNEKNAWDDFWKDAVKQANEGRPSPLSGIVRDYGRDDKKKDGTGTVHTVDYPRISGGAPLYSTLSVDIHHYAVGPEDVAPVSSHCLERDVFNALKPQKENILSDGTVNWELERARFVGSNKSTSAETEESSETEEL